MNHRTSPAPQAGTSLPSSLSFSMRAVVAALVALPLLSACGGGGSSSDSSQTNSAPLTSASTSLVAKYVGTWKGCLGAEPGMSHLTTLVFKEAATNKLAFTAHRDRFESLDCSGPVKGSLDEDGVVTVLGPTKLIAGVTADEALYSVTNFSMSGTFSLTRPGGFGSVSLNWALALDGTNLSIAAFSPLDPADKFPTTFIPGLLSKQ